MLHGVPDGPAIGDAPVNEQDETETKPQSVAREYKSKMSANKPINEAKFAIGQLVRHRLFSFRGVIFDVDPEFANTEEWYESIPEEIRPRRDQPFYHLFAENEETEYIAYVSEQNLLIDDNREPVRHPQVDEVFVRTPDGDYKTRDIITH